MKSSEPIKNEVITNVRDALAVLRAALGTNGLLLGDNQVAAVIIALEEWLVENESS